MKPGYCRGRGHRVCLVLLATYSFKQSMTMSRGLTRLAKGHGAEHDLEIVIVRHFDSDYD